MENSKQAPKKKHTNEQLIPYQWFWTNVYGERMGFVEWVKSRKFTILYLLVIWSMFLILGRATTKMWRCDQTWQFALACDNAIWMIKMVTAPIDYILSWFTAPFFHNGLDHILFVTIFGFLMPVQSFEMQHGTKSTVAIFLISYAVVGIFFGTLFNLGIYYWPDEVFFQYGFERSWMGGSVGFYAIIGALACYSKKPWVLLGIIVCFELINLTVVGISIHISMIHTVSCLSGLLSAYFLRKTKLRHNFKY
ncbi:MAG: hypothetical protein ABJH98_18325 [Reichenbachiella sp.]|uniref:hypothetical protein n=1 Tax=Reichenbachiella sp. TaxID=2184521 RepID=UPI0032998D3D